MRSRLFTVEGAEQTDLTPAPLADDREPGVALGDSVQAGYLEEPGSNIP